MPDWFGSLRAARSQGMDRGKPEELVARVPFSTVLASIVGLWVCYFVLTTLRAELLDLGFAEEMMWRRGLSSLAGIAITIGLWLVLRLFDTRPLWLKITAALLLALPFAISIAQANYLIFRDMEKPVAERMEQQQNGGIVAERDEDILLDMPDVQARGAGASGTAATTPESWLQLIELSIGRYYLLLAWCALYLALLTGEKARAAERREGAYRRAAKAAELRSLRYQVNPHFLFNTLNSLSALVLTGKTEQAERMIQMISTFYRRSLADDPTSDVPLSEEIALQRLYLDLEAVRFPNRLRARYDIAPGLEDVLIPGMILQPLVENSVKHAVAPSSGAVTITLAAREEYGRLVVTVSDDGGAAEKSCETRLGYGIGLANVRERLEARFGDEASIVSGPSPEGYVTHLRLPIMRAKLYREAAQ